MNIADLTGAAAYIAILLAAMLEGEIVFVAAAALVSQGQLNPFGVAAAGALGAAMGDQIYFYLFRGRLRWVIDRWPAVARQGEKLARRVRRADTLAIFAIRFSPGLRVALSAACAYAGVSPIKFSLLNTASAITWAISLLAIVAWAGPHWLGHLGIAGWWSAILPAVLLLALFGGGQILNSAIESRRVTKP